MKKFLKVFLFSLSACSPIIAQSDEIRAELGAEMSQLYLPVRPVGSVQYQPALGAIASLRICKRTFIDGSINITPSKPLTSTAFAGGRALQAYVGIRLGYSIRRVRLDAKARPGFASFGEAILRLNQAGNFDLGRLTVPALDFGGVLTIRVSRRIAVRYEAGDAVLFYSSRVVDSRTLARSGEFKVNTLQIGSGLVVRF